MNILKWDGKAISRPGLYRGVPISVYHSGDLCVGPSISSSGLRTIVRKSEAHFYDRWPKNKHHDPKALEESDALILGRAVHHLLMGGLSEEHFAKAYVVPPGKTEDAKGVTQPWSLRFASAREWVEARHAEGKTILSHDGRDRVYGMARALSKQPLVIQGALNGETELTMVWRHGTGIWLLARPDVIPTADADIVDLKTTTSIVPYDLQRTVFEFGYHMQGAMIAEGYEQITKNKIASFSLYFIESSRPFCPFLYRLDDEDMKRGRLLNERAITRFFNALETDVWPGPGGVQHSERVLRLNDRAREIEGRLLGA